MTSYKIDNLNKKRGPGHEQVKLMSSILNVIYRVIQKDGLNFVCLYFLNYTWYVNDLHNI